ncbi:MAG: hypothetical protein ACYCPW_04065 [Nitrososphaerales archaeon]
MIYNAKKRRLVSMYNEGVGRCPNCDNPMDNCACVCPYCGEISRCDCAIGYGVATGG